MHIQLLIPGLLWPAATLLGPASGLALDGLATLLGRGRRQVREFEPYDRQLARLFGLDGAELPLGTLRRLGEADAPPARPGSHWLCADPVNLSFAREHLLLYAFPDGELTLDEAAPLVAALNEVFADLGRFEACSPTRWYLQLDKPARVTLYPVDDVIGRPVKHFLPEGDDARLWQRTMNEAQIVLYNHAASRAREAAGQRAVNSIWLWGAGELAHAPLAPAKAVQATDPLSLGLARAAGVPAGAPDIADALRSDSLVVLDTLRKPAQQLDLEGWRDGLQAIEHDWFAPLAAASGDGRLKTLRLCAPSDRGTLDVEVRSADRWKFWRKPHAFDALLKSIAPPPLDLPGTPPPTHSPTDR
ncbi:hypothetical protein [Thauera linaloolentis]|uniref:Regulatory protein n=1 Tax=Thauera linaloolentis (strain DSM 12138 / JCM 21573 / CCUG 41526 / CIP 105981 / IAM 15112 / NBRC 102519 / 47Lol) TaxID=1123367 RepID=N6YVM5_THAL4|nr:hypothetical protein [Thauera linaloolentis]ENO84004.1 hypothetical protein C666_18050 [Thauera linaloolentis 47Lol = DSM 12138]MCM8565813.1 hypothetical protein [Thauera linaloolentis]